MEIDFMGLYSQSPAPVPPPDASFVDPGIERGEGDVSLSLFTSSPREEKAVLQDFLRKKTRKSPVENMASIHNSALIYDWENAQPSGRSTISRNKFEPPLSFQVSSTAFSAKAAPTFFAAQKTDRKMFATGDASFDDTPKSKDGYTPTVAMARRATLARFLEKRSHRLNQQIKPHLMGRPLDWSEVGDTAFTKYNKKIKDSSQYDVLM
ncbi:protein TIFY 4A-like [Dorcoceras hygrometricum]|uniref:Protein TIFY 4A-like n=1 Tax=Dorcoceras hygrometricum TaxID=472368 RepID=A0A2Z7CYQ5_9LAMI|nr:protein TIFY 4A-like [Dorcoceras hygrometricum]